MIKDFSNNINLKHLKSISEAIETYNDGLAFNENTLCPKELLEAANIPNIIWLRLVTDNGRDLTITMYKDKFYDLVRKYKVDKLKGLIDEKGHSQ